MSTELIKNLTDLKMLLDDWQAGIGEKDEFLARLEALSTEISRQAFTERLQAIGSTEKVLEAVNPANIGKQLSN